MYEYRAFVLDVVDGDTLHVEVDLGCDCRTRLTIRLAGVNAPEHGTAEGEAATNYVRVWVHDHAGADGEIRLDTIKDRREKYGRYLGVIRGWNESIVASERPGLGDADRELNVRLVEEGHAVPYSGGPRT